MQEKWGKGTLSMSGQFQTYVYSHKQKISWIPGDQPELSKCMMLLLLKYKRKLVGDGLELKRIAERLLI